MWFASFLLKPLVSRAAREREARARAFLKVPLYSAIFERYNGSVLAPAAALERELVGLVVAEKQTGRARQVFERSPIKAVSLSMVAIVWCAPAHKRARTNAAWRTAFPGQS
jgi:hypothetical protein